MPYLITILRVAGLYSLTLLLFQKTQRVKSCNLYWVTGLYSLWAISVFLFRVLHLNDIKIELEFNEIDGGIFHVSFLHSIGIQLPGL